MYSTSYGINGTQKREIVNFINLERMIVSNLQTWYEMLEGMCTWEEYPISNHAWKIRKFTANSVKMVHGEANSKTIFIF